MNTSTTRSRLQTGAGDHAYTLGADGVFRPWQPVAHRNDEYDESGFEVLLQMQENHFWYRGRHRFLLHAVRKYVCQPAESAIDLGGGCGGWLHYLHHRAPGWFSTLALGDSSLRALEFARQVLPPAAARYQVDLLRLGWTCRWDAIFLLDVLEHIPQDREALVQVREALCPGGLLFVTTPALPFFWSYNDDLAGHQKRYTRQDFAQLAHQVGLELVTSRYFMFFLSPLLYLSRRKHIDVRALTQDEIDQLVAHSHRVPALPVNALLAGLFALETPLGHWLPFPWGTSILGVFRRP